MSVLTDRRADWNEVLAPSRRFDERGSAISSFPIADTFEGEVTDPQSLHKYAYVHGDPVNNIDPTGQMSLVGCIGTMGAISGLVTMNVAGIQEALRPGSTPGSLFAAMANGFAGGFVWGAAGAGLILTAPVALAGGAVAGLTWANGFAGYLALSGWATGKAGNQAIKEGHPIKAQMIAISGSVGIAVFVMSIPTNPPTTAIVSVGPGQVVKELKTPREILMPEGLPLGASGTKPTIRTLTGGIDEAQAIFDKLTLGGKDVTPKNYPGKFIELPTGGRVGLRAVSSDGKPAIDVSIEGVPFIKIHFE